MIIELTETQRQDLITLASNNYTNYDFNITSIRQTLSDSWATSEASVDDWIETMEHHGILV